MAALLKYIPGNLMLTIQAKAKNLVFDWEGGAATYPLEGPKDFPDSALRQPLAEADIDGDLFVGAISEALDYTATENARPVLNAVAAILGNVTQICGADGFRSSYESLK